MISVVPLGSLATFGKGSGLAKSDLAADGAHLCIHYGELFTQYGAVIDAVRSHTDRDLPVKSAKGDVLMPTSDVTPRGLAKASVIQRSGIGLGGDVLVIRPDQSKADPRFIAYVIRHDADQVLALVRGSTVYHLYATDMWHFEVPCLPIAEQTRVANALEDADGLIAVLERMIAKQQSIKQGILQELLSGRSRLPGFHAAWLQAIVGEVAEVKTGPFGSALHESDYVRSGTPIITVEHLGDRAILPVDVPRVSDADLRRLRAYTLRAGDVVFSRVGAIDRNALISKHEEGWLFSGRLLRVRFDMSKADPAFMSAQFHSQTFRDAVRSVAVGQTMASLNTAILRSIAVHLPPVEEQREIGRIVDDINEELDALEARLRQARSIKLGMMQELLTGRTRLPIAEVAA